MFATPWEDPRTINFVLLSGLIGLATFCASYAWNVWRRRNRNSTASSGERHYSHWRVAFSILAGCGLIAVLAACAIREACPPSGQIIAERLFTVRAREDYQVLTVADATRVAKGDIIARFNSPPIAAESVEFAARIAEEQADRAKAEVTAVQLDEELVRRHQNAISRQQQFRASRDQILPAREAVALLKTQSELERRDKLAHLDDEKQTVLGDLKIANTRQALAKEDLRRIEALGRQNAVTAGQLDEARTRVAAVVDEIAKLTARRGALDNEIHQVEASKAELASECDRQLKRYEQELDRIESALAASTIDESRCEQLLAEDRTRAEKVKTFELAKLAAKVRQSEAKQTGARQTLEITAPFSGNVVYRERSPNTAEPNDALLVLGVEDGLVMRLRLPIDQISSLQAAGEVECELTGAALVPFFAASYKRHEQLDRRPAYALVELACQLPPDAVREVVHGRTVVARLLWRPPLWTMWLFKIGVLSLVAGLVGWAAVGRLTIRTQRASKARSLPGEKQSARSKPVSDGDSPTANGTDVSTVRELAYGELAASLRMLGDRFRTSLIEGQLDEHLIAAVEWALDRHHARAVQLLAESLAADEQIASSIAELVDIPDSENPRMHTSHRADARTARRVTRILSTIAPTLLDDVLAER
jgi:hypothetical protein